MPGVGGATRAPAAATSALNHRPICAPDSAGGSGSAWQLVIVINCSSRLRACPWRPEPPELQLEGLRWVTVIWLVTASRLGEAKPGQSQQWAVVRLAGGA